jgi:succinate dehydrogenase / fumarate reductase cytochrome b subunit
MKEQAIMNKNRPMNLDLTTLAFPAQAIASILHRLSGLAIFILLPFVMYALQLSLKDSSAFTDLKISLANPYNKFMWWSFLTAAWYHSIAGIRHLVMDLGFGESVHQGRLTAWMVIILGIVGSIGLGIWVC